MVRLIERMWRDWFVCSDVSRAFKACQINEVMSWCGKVLRDGWSRCGWTGSEWLSGCVKGSVNCGWREVCIEGSRRLM